MAKKKKLSAGEQFFYDAMNIIIPGVLQEVKEKVYKRATTQGFYTSKQRQHGRNDHIEEAEIIE